MTIEKVDLEKGTIRSFHLRFDDRKIIAAETCASITRASVSVVPLHGNHHRTFLLRRERFATTNRVAIRDSILGRP